MVTFKKEVVVGIENDLNKVTEPILSPMHGYHLRLRKSKMAYVKKFQNQLQIFSIFANSGNEK